MRTGKEGVYKQILYFGVPGKDNSREGERRSLYRRRGYYANEFRGRGPCARFDRKTPRAEHKYLRSTRCLSILLRILSGAALPVIAPGIIRAGARQ